jgi:putative oxidoreductase
MRRFPAAPRADYGLLLLRITVAVVVLFHGVFKLAHGVEWIRGPLGRFGLPGWLAYGVYLAEVVGPVLLIAGLFARWAALVIAFDMLMAILLVGRQRVVSVNQAGGWGIELELLIGIAALTIAVAGTGRFAALRDS